VKARGASAHGYGQNMSWRTGRLLGGDVSRGRDLRRLDGKPEHAVRGVSSGRIGTSMYALSSTHL
jgi:hypothetical protein